MQRISSVIMSALVLAGLSLHLAAQQDVEVIELKPGIQLKKKIVKTTTQDGEKHIVVKVMTADEEDGEGENGYRVFVQTDESSDLDDTDNFVFSDEDTDFESEPFALDEVFESDEIQKLMFSVLGALQQADIQVDGKPLQIVELFNGDHGNLRKLMTADDINFNWNGRRIHVPLEAGRKLLAAIRKHRGMGSCDSRPCPCNCRGKSHKGNMKKKHAFTGHWSSRGPGAAFMKKRFPQRHKAMMKHMKKRFAGARQLGIDHKGLTKGPGPFFLRKMAKKNDSGCCNHAQGDHHGSHSKAHGKAHGHHRSDHGAQHKPSCHIKSKKAHHGGDKKGSCDKKGCAPKAPRPSRKHRRTERKKTMHFGHSHTPSEIPLDGQNTVRLTLKPIPEDDTQADEDDMAKRLAELEVLIQELREKIADLKRDL